ncbi:MAG TPA: tripartite tricarboxylate transporter substrate binding protein [Burkholderiales bacterium]|nr:tripartite tricarboxylate transporter substrate binding protein [Burkholderiales bacterium]
MRRPILALALAACALAAASDPSLDQYPVKPVRIIVPYPPGGTTDILARLVATRLTDKLGQTFVVENRPGAAGAIGSQSVAKSAPDGYTLVMGTISSHGINAALYKSLPYDPVKDFAPVTNVASTPNVITVNPDLPVKNLGELLRLAKEKPGKLNFGSTSQGGSPHMSAELLKMMTGADLVHVPYKGAGPMLVDLIGGQVQIGFDNLPSSMGHIRSGKVRAIAVTTAARWPGAPEIPTVAESGVADYEVSGWFGLLAPAGTPQPVVDALYKALSEILKQPDVQKQLLELGAAPVGNPPDAFGRQIAGEVEKWKKVVTATGVKAQ